MKTPVTCFAILALLGLSVACAGPKIQATADPGPSKAKAEVFAEAIFVEDAGDGWQRLRCRGEGADRQSAIQNARKSGLVWLASTRLAQNTTEQKKLQEKIPTLLTQLEQFVRAPSGGGRMGPQGLVQQVRRPKGVMVTLMAEVNEAGVRSLLEEWGVLDKLALPDGRKLTILLRPSDEETAKVLPLLQALVFSTLKHLPLDWLDLPGSTSADHAANLTMAREASADLLMEVTAEEKRNRESLSCSLTFRLTNMRKNTLAASATAQSGEYYAGRPANATRALQEAANDASAKLSPQLPQVIKSFASP